jgi:hypothetical protein
MAEPATVQQLLKKQPIPLPDDRGRANHEYDTRLTNRAPRVVERVLSSPAIS